MFLRVSVMFKFPLFREFVMAGGVCDVSKQSINNICKSGTGNAAVIVVGGAAESLEARPGVHKLKLKTRKGFVKIALQNGYDKSPTFIIFYIYNLKCLKFFVFSRHILENSEAMECMG